MPDEYFTRAIWPNYLKYNAHVPHIENIFIISGERQTDDIIERGRRFVMSEGEDRGAEEEQRADREALVRELREGGVYENRGMCKGVVIPGASSWCCML